MSTLFVSYIGNSSESWMFFSVWTANIKFGVMFFGGKCFGKCFDKFDINNNNSVNCEFCILSSAKKYHFHSSWSLAIYRVTMQHSFFLYNRK